MENKTQDEFPQPDTIIEAFQELGKAMDECANSFSDLVRELYHDLVIRTSAIEANALYKMLYSCSLVRWYYRAKYRKAKYNRIKAERAFRDYQLSKSE